MLYNVPRTKINKNQNNKIKTTEIDTLLLKE
jgi:hypothetical protein